MIISLEGWSNYASTEHKGSEAEKLQVYLVELEGKLVLTVETVMFIQELHIFIA